MREAMAVANHILSLTEENGCTDVTPMKLQKLVYIAAGWHLAVTSVELFEDQIQAWHYGPVIPSVYHEFKVFGRAPIPPGMRGLSSYDGRTPDIEHHDSDARSLVKRVVDVYCQFTAEQLSAMTHQPGSPWAQTIRKNCRGLKFPAIDNEIIRKHYLEKLEENENRDPKEQAAG